MANTAQINANRQNAQKSTGPRSAEGKAKVAKNAVKHGLFALESVIKGEKQEDFDLFRDEMIAELAPAGAVESMLAERFVSLSWRLARVERIQNQAIDAMIDKQLNSPLARMAEGMLPKSLRKQNTDGPEADDLGPKLTLGKVAIKDFSNSRVLERLLMYERRIENSMLKTMDELRRRRIMRELEQAREELSPDMDQPQAKAWLKSATRLPQDVPNKGVTEDRRLRTEDRRLRTEDRRLRTEGRKRKAEDGWKNYGKQTQFRLAPRPVLGVGHGHNGHG